MGNRTQVLYNSNMNKLILFWSALLMAGCGESQQTPPSLESKQAKPVTKAPDLPIHEAAKERKPTEGITQAAISIYEAAKEGNIEAVKQHIAAGTDVNAPGNRDIYGMGYTETPTDAARRNFHGGGHSPAPKNLPQDHPHHTFKEIVELLKKHGGHSGSIHVAVQSGDIAGVKALLNGRVNLNKTNLGGRSPLHLAAEKGHKEIASLLLDKGAEIDFGNWSDKTALHYAAEKGHIEIIELLLIKGANVNALGDAQRGTPLDLATRFKRNKRNKTANLLRKHGGKTAEEVKAEEEKTTEPDTGVSALPSTSPAEAKSVKPVAEAKKPEPLTPKAPNLPIHYASRKGNIEVVRQQIAAGTDVNVKNNFGSTPLHHASAAGHREIVELLIIAGADVNGKMNNGITPLGSASFIHERTPDSKKTKNDIITLLRKHGAKTRAELKAEGL